MNTPGILPIFGFVSGALVILASATYIKSIVKKETQPDKGANIVWAATSSLAFFAYLADGAQDSLWFAAGDFVVGLVMLLLVFKFGYGWRPRRHIPALAVAAMGLALWYTTNVPFIALLSSVLVDAVGTTLVVIKAYEAPSTEHLNSWVIYLVAGLFSAAAVGKFDLTLLFYPAYAVAASTAVISAIYLGRKLNKMQKVDKPTILTGPIP